MTDVRTLVRREGQCNEKADLPHCPLYLGRSYALHLKGFPLNGSEEVSSSELGIEGFFGMFKADPWSLHQDWDDADVILQATTISSKHQGLRKTPGVSSTTRFSLLVTHSFKCLRLTRFSESMKMGSSESLAGWWRSSAIMLVMSDINKDASVPASCLKCVMKAKWE
eukprot:CAMPEP_0170635864 /NCGR_PEP_ID=MMETSP0224-20130122/37460_1 /TAXON_ID=285029 /ORGANISM="Togula jolla, Strain CCCM 725" /LENGTH=166 /DNA_ID=CAMNT_0010965415 /DNA_START=177 /DNA_END=678 /DNA_ORIENTATION=+